MADARLDEPFSEPGQQRRAATLGMFVFLATEIMLFGGLVLVLLVTRYLHPADVVAASRRLHTGIGAANTAILLTSSLAVAVAVEAARSGRARLAAWCLITGAALGLAFLGVKAVEYAAEYREGLLPLAGVAFASPGRHLFMNLYLVSTALHALHVAIGVTLLAVIALRTARGGLALPRDAIVVETSGFYWHLVDAIWVLLFPLLYLAR